MIHDDSGVIMYYDNYNINAMKELLRSCLKDDCCLTPLDAMSRGDIVA